MKFAPESPPSSSLLRLSPHFPFLLPSIDLIRLCGTIVFLFSMAGCNGSDSPIVSHGGPVHNHVSLVDTLRAKGMKVEPTGPILQPFFHISGQMLRVNNEDIQVFEFQNSSAAQSQANEISPDGHTIGDTAIQWINPPHFFLSGKILVLYLGTDAEILKILEIALGKQIAGANPFSSETERKRAKP
jgi:hypothetical protein